jgi:hypothetical protein
MTNHELCTDKIILSALCAEIRSTLQTCKLPQDIDSASLSQFLTYPFGIDSPQVRPETVAQYLSFVRAAVSAAVLLSLANIDQIEHEALSEVLRDIESLLSVLALRRTCPADSRVTLQ